MLSASKVSHSDSTSGPSAISQPIETKMSSTRSETRLIGCRAPSGRRGHAHRHVDGLLDEDALVALGLELGLPRASACDTWPRAWPTRLPASALALGGSAPISRLASASGALLPLVREPGGLELVEGRAAAIAAGRRRRPAPARRGRARRPRRGRTACWVLTCLPLCSSAGRHGAREAAHGRVRSGAPGLGRRAGAGA